MLTLLVHQASSKLEKVNVLNLWHFMITHFMFRTFVTWWIRMTSCGWSICFSLSLSCYCKDHSQLNHTLTFITQRWLLSCHADQGSCLTNQCILCLQNYLYSILMHDITLCLLTKESSQTQHNNRTAVFDCFPLYIWTLWNKCQWFLCFLRLLYTSITRISHIPATN